MTPRFVPRTSHYVSFLLRAWRGTDEQGETVWRFALVAPADGSTRILHDPCELLQVLGVETATRDTAANRKASDQATRSDKPKPSVQG